MLRGPGHWDSTRCLEGLGTGKALGVRKAWALGCRPRGVRRGTWEHTCTYKDARPNQILQHASTGVH